MQAPGDEGFHFMHLSFTSISCTAEVREQPLLIKISEQSHVCRCLPCRYQKTSTHQIAAVKQRGLIQADSNLNDPHFSCKEI